MILLFRKHAKLMILITVLCGLAGYGISSLLITPKYESNAILIINADQSSQTSITYDQISAAKQLVNTYEIILKSDTVLEQVIKNLNLDTEVKKMEKGTLIEGVNNTEVIQISVRNTDAQTAADIANEIVRIAPSLIVNTIKLGSVEVISRAKTSEQPIFPNKCLFAGISLLAGLTAAVLLVLSFELMNNTFVSGEDVQKFLDFPVIGVIPDIRKQLIS